jgi:subtilisin family serine protease
MRYLLFGRNKRYPRGSILPDKLHLESLEGRLLLSGNPALDDLVQWTVDPDSYEPGSILVRYRDGTSCSNTDCLVVASPARALGTHLERAFSLVPGLEQIRLPQNISVDQALAAYRSDPHVLYAEPDYRVHATLVPNDIRYGELWGLNNDGQTGGKPDADIDMPEAWDVTTTSDVVVAVIDTGVDYTHEDLAANMWVNPGETPGDGIDNDGNGYIDDLYGYDFANDDPDPMDDHSHGTHVAGTIGAVGNNGIGVTGVNWDVQIMAIKFLDASGNGTTSDAVDAINYAVQMGASLSNNSWGGNEPFSQALYDAIAAARNRDHVFVAGAGNGDIFGNGQNNDTNPFYPAAYNLDNIISVAATDASDQRATFSNYGLSSVDLAAPGVNILSTVPGNTYQSASGTSMATPHVAGVASLVRAQHPDWTYEQVVNQILGTVDPVSSMQGITVTGGRLNAASALGNPAPPPPPPAPGTIPIVEDFEDGVAQFFDVQSGTWDVSSGRFHVTPTVDDDSLSAISTLLLASLPSNVQMVATVNASPEPDGILKLFFGYMSNAYTIFDYHSETDFKFAGLDVSGQRWLLGQRTLAGWQTIESLADTAIQPSTNYTLMLVIQNDSQLALHVDGVAKLSHAFSDPLSDGRLGVGVRNSISHFDNILVDVYVPPAWGSLPLQEDFSDGVADFFQHRVGAWNVSGGRLRATPSGDAITTLRIVDPLPNDLEIRATINADLESGNFYSDALVIFDYQSPTDFKFAGAYARADKWVIGHRTSSTWVTDAFLAETIHAATDYQLGVVIVDDSIVTLTVDGVQKVNHSFSGAIIDGEIGVGTWNAFAYFDDVLVQQYVPAPPPPPPPAATLPVQEDFSDGVADFFQVPVGSWQVSGGRYHATPSGDAITTLLIQDPLPADLELHATINADPESGSFYSDALLIFDYQSPTDFKFAGAYARADKWVVGHRTSSTWVTDASFAETILAATDYQLEVIIENGSNVSLFVNGVRKVGHSFAESVTNGDVGVGTWNAFAHFDDVLVQPYVPPPPPPAATLPLQEDFSDGVADFFQVRAGSWEASGGRYHAAPNGDAISTLQTAGALPTNLDLRATINADLESGSFYSDALVIFDYQSATDFKFAGAYARADRWVIGHRTTKTWVTDAYLGERIDAATDYPLQVIIQNDTAVTLKVGGVTKVSASFAGSLTDGQIGVGTWNAFAHFDDVLVQPYGVSASAAGLPTGAAVQNNDYGSATPDSTHSSQSVTQDSRAAENAGNQGTAAGESGAQVHLSAPLSERLDPQQVDPLVVAGDSGLHVRRPAEVDAALLDEGLWAGLTSS